MSRFSTTMHVHPKLVLAFTIAAASYANFLDQNSNDLVAHEIPYDDYFYVRGALPEAELESRVDDNALGKTGPF